MEPENTAPTSQDERQSGLSRFVGSVAFVDRGEPTLKISVNRRVVTFVDHLSYCPIAVHPRTGEALKRQPDDFLKAVTLWYQQGKLVEDGLCQWMHDAEPILKKIGGRWIVDGYMEPVCGE